MMLSRRGWAPRLVAVCLAATSRATATLVAYYSFDDGTAADDGDGSLDGIVSGATASTGPDGSGALSFDGSNDYVKFPDALTSGILGSNARTVCLWAAISSFNDAALFTFGDYADGEEFALMTAASAGGFIVQLYGGDYDTDVSVSGWSDDDGWHFYCLVYDGAEWSFYVDGAVAHTATASLATGSENILTIGVRDGESYLTGSVDELYVYSSALSESEIQTLVGDTLIAYPSTTARPPRTATAASTAPSAARRRRRAATERRAVVRRRGRHAEFPDAVTADIAGDSARTVCLWAAIDAFNGGGLFMYGGSDYNAEYGEFGLAADVVSGSVEITISATLLNNLVTLSGSDDGDWHHYCLSYDGATLALYYDAALAYSGAAELATSDSPLEIGGGSIHLSGSIDEVYAYTSALDADAIEELYDSYGVSPNPTPAPTPTPTPEPTPTPTPRPTVECLRVSFSERVIAADLDSTEAVYAVDVDGDGDSFTERIITDSVDDALPVYALDVDGDGDADVLSGSSSDNTFSWYENDAAQSFTERAIAVLADSAKSVFAIDVDGDGDVDVLSASEDDDTVAWYENDGSQSFTERVISDEADGVASVQAIDIDGDGDVDGVSALADGNAVVWCENDGAQSFTGHEVAYGGDRRLTDSFSSDASDSISLVAADSLVSGAQCAFAIDVDGDGDVDVLSAAYDDAIAWHENDGSQGFTEHVISDEADGAHSVYAIDADGDGDIDVLAAYYDSNEVAWHENDGAESFAEHVITDSAASAAAVFAIDADGDGDVDVLSASAGDATIAWYENDCDSAPPTAAPTASAAPTLSPAPTLSWPPTPRPTVRCLSVAFSARAITEEVESPRSVFAIDVDGDGDVDVLSASEDDDTVAWYENDGSQSFSDHLIVDTADGAMSVFAIDVDGDGDVDALSASYNDDTVAWYENDGEESFTTRVVADSALGPRSVVATDVDGDGDIDVLSASASDDTVAWYENDGTESFAERVISDEADGPYTVFVIDVDGDGDVDALASRRAITDSADGANEAVAIDVDGDGDVDALSASAVDDTVAWYENDGQESFTTRVITDSADSAVSVIASDLDQDGDVDVLSTSTNDNTVAWYENDCATRTPTASPSVSAAPTYPVTPRPTARCASVAFSDRTISDEADNANSVFAIDVDGDGDVDSFTERIITAAADQAACVFAIDVDDDGDVDVLSASYNDDTIAWYENYLPEGFADRVITAAANEAWSVYAIDVDGDGDVDVLSASRNDDTVAWYENDGEESFTERIITTLAGGVRSAFAVDVDGDGDVDALSASFTGDTVAWYENDGAQSFAERVVAASQDGPSVVFAIDLDGDDDVDAVSVVENDDAVMWFENDGQQAFAEFAVVSVSNPLAAFAIDVDNDGDVDVLHGAYSNDVSWHENDGQQSFTAKQVNTGSVGQTYTVYATDVDGDGDVDALSACRNNDNVFWYENDCATFAPTVSPFPSAAPTARPTHVSQSTLVAHYSFDDGAASEDTDGDLDGTVSGATASDGRGGETDGALYFDGNSYVEFPSEVTEAVGGDGARTVCLWAAISSFDDAALFTFGDYADGEEFALMTAASAGGENLLTIGVRDGESYLTGSVDELYVYSSALSESEVQALYFQDTLVAYYSFDDGTAADDLGGLDGTIHGATATTGQYGSGALSFDGEDDYVEFPSAVTTDILGSDPRTVCLWAMIDAFNDGGLFEYGSSAPDQAFAIRTAGDSSVYVELYGSGAVLTSDATDGDWHHYCLTYDGSDWAFYFDGSQAETGTHALDTGSDNALRLGQWNTAHYFDGSIDEVYVFSISLDEASIQVLYDARDAFVVPSSTPPAVALSERESVEWSFFLSERESVEQSFFEPERGAFFEPERGAIFESFCDAERSVRGAAPRRRPRPALRRAVVLADGRALRRALAVPEREPFEQPFFDALRGAVVDAFRHSVVEPLFVSERSSDHRADGFVRANHERRHGIDARVIPGDAEVNEYTMTVAADGDADDGGAFDGRSDHGITDDGVALDARAVDGRAHDGPSDDGRADDGRALDRGALDRGADDRSSDDGQAIVSPHVSTDA
ncbi:hypothetical protein JL720_15301 [Aureococcus anophagefferens]|nr:hypothetical protein JL720_15301 [Aureococcus anophagefferens]